MDFQGSHLAYIDQLPGSVADGADAQADAFPHFLYLKP